MNDQGKLIGGFSSAGAPMPNDLSIYFGLLPLAQVRILVDVRLACRSSHIAGGIFRLAQDAVKFVPAMRLFLFRIGELGAMQTTPTIHPYQIFRVA